jgi:hypothetical protein
VRAALDGGDRVLRLGLDRLDELGDLLRAAARALGEIFDLVGDDREALAVLTRLSGDDGGVQREQVRLLGDVVDDREDLPDGLDAVPRLEMTATASWLDSLMRLISPIVLRMASAPRSRRPSRPPRRGAPSRSRSTAPGRWRRPSRSSRSSSPRP